MYDVVIIDECTSFVMHASSDTMEKKLDPCLAVIGNHLKNSSYVYAIDADISPGVVSLLMGWRAHDPPYLIQYTHKPLSGRCLYLTQSKRELLFSLTRSLRGGKNCVLVLQTIKESEQLLHYFSDKATSILLFNKKGATSFMNGSLQFENSKQQSEQFLTDTDKHFPFCQLLIYTPCIKTGVSFEKPHFNRLYAIASQKSSTAREFQQGLLRVRNVSSSKYILHLGNTFIGSLQNQCSRIEEIKRKNAANYFLATSKFNPLGLCSLQKTDILQKSGFHKFTSDFLAISKSDAVESEKHFGVSLLTYLCIERGFSFAYLHQLETIPVMDMANDDADEWLFQLPVLQVSTVDSVSFVETVSKAPNITVQMSYELLRKKQFGEITEDQLAQLARYQFKTCVGIPNYKDSILTTQFLKMYLDRGMHIKTLQHLLPSEYSNEGQIKKLAQMHLFFQRLLEQKLQCLAKK